MPDTVVKEEPEIDILDLFEVSEIIRLSVVVTAIQVQIYSMYSR